ncbi:hypothetical protein AMJ86_00700 [bacterium SM23_57]|nr:MAG: hypothetical protein AMJ86_00700 [bacterium SM23_57]
METIDKTHEIFLKFCDEFNEHFPKEKMAPKLQQLIMIYLGMAYGIGYDTCINELRDNLPMMVKSNGTITASELRIVMRIPKDIPIANSKYAMP